MLRSLYSGVSGMKANQTKMDVIGNNVANVSTTAFKASRATFADLFSQTIADASASTDTGIGGINPSQVGLGVTVAGISTLTGTGSLNYTGNDLDFAINGEGYFMVSPQNGSDGETITDISYTRDGSFSLDSEGYLVTSSGLHVIGVALDEPSTSESDVTDVELGALSDIADNLGAIQIPPSYNDEQLDSYSIDSTGVITAIYGGETYYIGKITLASFVNPAGLEKAGGNTYIVSNNSGSATVGTAGDSGFGTIKQSYLEASNVDLATEFTEMIITSRAYQANSKTITTSDEMLQYLLNMTS